MSSTVVVAIIAAGSAVLNGILLVINGLIISRSQRITQETQKLKEQLNKEKTNLYFEVLEFLRKLVDNEIEPEETIEKFNDYYKRLIYYGSSGVIKSFGDFMQFMYKIDQPEKTISKQPNPLEIHRLYGDLVIEIRKDLGHSGRASWLDIVRIGIRDIADYLPTAYQGDRGKKTSPRNPLRLRRKFVKDHKSRNT